jgi:hypothetical protein
MERDSVELAGMEMEPGSQRPPGSTKSPSTERQLRHNGQCKIIAIAAGVAGLQVVPVHIPIAPFGRLLKVPLIGVAAVFLITVRTVP